ncbi:MAG: hypothetical protein ACT4P6_09410 [Gemmatimonadaceae bacterium]
MSARDAHGPRGVFQQDGVGEAAEVVACNQNGAVVAKLILPSNSAYRPEMKAAFERWLELYWDPIPMQGSSHDAASRREPTGAPATTDQRFRLVVTTAGACSTTRSSPKRTSVTMRVMRGNANSRRFVGKRNNARA